MATSVFGYLLFGEDTLSDVLSNFDADLEVPYSQVFADLVRVGYAIHIILVYPLLQFSLRVILDGLLFPEATTPLALDNRRFIPLTVCVLGISWAVACYVPDIWYAFQITGSTVGALIGFIIPAVLVLR
jgi:sodium-coupled neutral amino acid transporter 2